MWLSLFYLLLELLMYRIQRIFDGDTFQVSCRQLEAKWEMKVDLLYRWCRKVLLEHSWVIDVVCRVIQLPINPLVDVFEILRQDLPVEFQCFRSDLDLGAFLLWMMSAFDLSFAYEMLHTKVIDVEYTRITTAFSCRLLSVCG